MNYEQIIKKIANNEADMELKVFAEEQAEGHSCGRVILKYYSDIDKFECRYDEADMRAGDGTLTGEDKVIYKEKATHFCDMVPIEFNFTDVAMTIETDGQEPVNLNWIAPESGYLLSGGFEIYIEENQTVKEAREDWIADNIYYGFDDFKNKVINAITEKTRN